MAIQNFNEDLNIIAKLPDAPTLTAGELKAKFDEGGLKIKDYINIRLIPEINAELRISAEALTAELERAAADIPAVSDSLNEDNAVKALSAAKGKELNGLINANTEALEGLKAQINSLTAALNGKQKTITYGQGSPSGGANGDIYLMY